MANASAAGGIEPAQLGFLAIFNPSLGSTDETIDDQIVYYSSVSTQSGSLRKRRRRRRSRPTEGISQAERHERLRQIGLAQGMANFSRGFADGAAVDNIDTERSRVVLHELEPGWWILASIDLTKVPLPPRLPTKSSEAQEEQFEYSSREMKPSTLLLGDLLRAHNIFLMHHGSSLSALFVRSKRSKFVALLGRYWDLYVSTWNVMLHGNPAREIFGGINLAASGELGVGVGEEERGSGEREVLEGLVGRIEGLVDLVVSKFGEHEPEEDAPETSNDGQSQWLGTGKEPSCEDGAIFLGLGALSKKSLRDVTHWMEDLYTWGEHAYGVIDSPTSTRRNRHRTASKKIEEDPQQPLTAVAEPSTSEVQEEPSEAIQPDGESSSEPAKQPAASDQDGKFNKMASYFKMGYGTYWNIPGTGTVSDTSTGSSQVKGPDDAPKQADNPKEPRPKPPVRSPSVEAAGHYLIGLMGEIEEGASDLDENQHSDNNSETEHNSRTVLRTLHVELESEAEGRPESMIVKDFEHPASIWTQSQVMGNMVPGYNSHDLNKAKKLRVVVYVNRPFIFTFLFELRTDSLAWDSLYRSLHYQLAPLKKPLLSSTSYRPEQPSTGSSVSNIFNLVWDPKAITFSSTIPNIPETYETENSWSRADALSTHFHILQIHNVTRAHPNDLERTQKTGRGWWIVWTRLLHRREETTGSNLPTIQESSAPSSSAGSAIVSENDASQSYGTEDENFAATVDKEIFLIRQASDHKGFQDRAGEGAGKLAQGIGVDTRRYVEELLSLL